MICKRRRLRGEGSYWLAGLRGRYLEVYPFEEETWRVGLVLNIAREGPGVAEMEERVYEVTGRWSKRDRLHREVVLGEVQLG